LPEKPEFSEPDPTPDLSPSDPDYVPPYPENSKKQGSAQSATGKPGKDDAYPIRLRHYRDPTGLGLTMEQSVKPFTRGDSAASVSPRTMFGYLKVMGATDKEALLLASAMSNESGGDPNAKHEIDRTHPDGKGLGLFGHNYLDRLDLRGKSWQEQAQAALYNLRDRPEGKLLDAAQTPEDLTVIEMHYEQPRGYKRRYPKDGDKYIGRLRTMEAYASLTKSGSPEYQDALDAGKAAREAEISAKQDVLVKQNGGPIPLPLNGTSEERYKAAKEYMKIKQPVEPDRHIEPNGVVNWPHYQDVTSPPNHVAPVIADEPMTVEQYKDFRQQRSQIWSRRQNLFKWKKS